VHIGNDPPERLRLNALERAVIRATAAALGEAGLALEQQLAASSVVSRNHSGVGFVTRLRIAEGASPLPAGAAGRLRPVQASHPELGEPAEFLVQVRDGYLASIEAFCREGMWPSDDSQFRVAPPAA
jgi:hypothetical protein